MTGFHFQLTDEEKAYLKTLVMRSIGHRLGLSPAPDMHPVSEKLKEPYGAFVTLHEDGQLRGCIGYIVGQGPLFETIAKMALAAAFEDPRFVPVGPKDYEHLDVEISILSPLTKVPDVLDIEVGTHGLYMKQGSRSGLLLPQVATEWNWDRETFLSQTCIKAGLPKDAWKDAKTEIYWFQAEVF